MDKTGALKIGSALVKKLNQGDETRAALADLIAAAEELTRGRFPDVKIAIFAAAVERAKKAMKEE